MTELEMKAACERMWGLCFEVFMNSKSSTEEDEKLKTAFYALDKELIAAGLKRRGVKWIEPAETPTF